MATLRPSQKLPAHLGSISTSPVAQRQLRGCELGFLGIVECKSVQRNRNPFWGPAKTVLRLPQLWCLVNGGSPLKHLLDQKQVKERTEIIWEEQIWEEYTITRASCT